MTSEPTPKTLYRRRTVNRIIGLAETMGADHIENRWQIEPRGHRYVVIHCQTLHVVWSDADCRSLDRNAAWRLADNLQRVMAEVLDERLRPQPAISRLQTLAERLAAIDAKYK